MVFRRKTFLLTGSSSDIGYACRDVIQRNGFKCICLYNPNSQQKEPDLADGDIAYPLDLASAKSIEETISHILEAYSIDSFISLGSINKTGSFWSTHSCDIQEHLFVNAVAPLLITRLLAQPMAKRQWGRITFTSSVGTLFGGSTSSFPYSLGKAAGEFIPVELKQLARYGVLTNIVRIGATNTRKYRSLGKDIQERADLIPAKRLAGPEEIAEYLYWISSPLNTYIHNQILPITGGE